MILPAEGKRNDRRAVGRDGDERKRGGMMMEFTLQILLSILTVAAVLSLLAVAIGWMTQRRRPALEHACWMIVLLRFVTPPLLPLAIPGFPHASLATNYQDTATS